MFLPPPQWEVFKGGEPTVADGVISLTDDGSEEILKVNVDGADDWSDQMIYARIKCTGGDEFGFYFYFTTVVYGIITYESGYRATLSVTDNKLYLKVLLPGGSAGQFRGDRLGCGAIPCNALPRGADE